MVGDNPRLAFGCSSGADWSRTNDNVRDRRLQAVSIWLNVFPPGNYNSVTRITHRAWSLRHKLSQQQDAEPARI